MGSNEFCTWHDEKAVRNFAKHGIAFAEIAKLFDGRSMLIQQDLRRDYGERRYNALYSLNGLLINIAYTERFGKIHLISARIASRRERAIFHDKEPD